MNGTIIILHTLQLLSADFQKQIESEYNNSNVEAKETESGIKYLLWK
jgi:hypothetical protein